ncbi:hypothetical protein BC830DRAFT_1100353 [Chytriomyces sp. MP71]|nr:hypothetical protein BC830DRAFT_1100353 [Chytriomyces sp. MP71]
MDYQFATITLLALPLLATVKLLAQFFLSSRLNKSALSRDVRGKHLLITGGSKGLGKAIAAQLVEAGANVTIVARGLDSLKKAASELEKLNSNVKIHYAAIDLGQRDAVVAGIKEIRAKMGKIDWVVANAGSALPGFVADQLDAGSAFEAMINQNYFSAVNVVRALIAVAKEVAEEKKIKEGGRSWAISGISEAAQEELPTKIILVGSVMSTLSFIGYSAYSASKFAQRGFADGLRSEFAPLGIDVHVYLPANMDTPGFVVENEYKPEITAQIEGAASTATPEDAASMMLAGVLNKRYFINNDALGELIRVVANGCAVRPNPITEALAAPALFLALSAWGVIADMEVKGFFKNAPKVKPASDGKKKE